MAARTGTRSPWPMRIVLVLLLAIVAAVGIGAFQMLSMRHEPERKTIEIPVEPQLRR